MHIISNCYKAGGTLLLGCWRHLEVKKYDCLHKKFWWQLLSFDCVYILSSKLPGRLFILPRIPQMCCIGWYFKTFLHIWLEDRFFDCGNKKRELSVQENSSFTDAAACWQACAKVTWVRVLEKQRIIWDSYRHMYSQTNPSVDCNLWCLQEPADDTSLKSVVFPNCSILQTS